MAAALSGCALPPLVDEAEAAHSPPNTFSEWSTANCVRLLWSL